MDVIEKSLFEIMPYHNNPRHNEDAVDAVAASIQEFGFQQPIVIDPEGVIVAGHTRYQAAKKLHLNTVPVKIADNLTPEQIRAYRLADNKTAELATWDFEKLQLEMMEIETIDMEPFGFEPAEEEDTTSVSEVDYSGSAPEEPRTKPGDLYQLGEHRLICGDSTDILVVDRLMLGKTADVIYTDPPYGMNIDTDYTSMRSKMAAGGNQYDQGSVDSFSPDMINTVFTIDADEIFLWGADYYAELIPERNAGSWIVWDKRSNDKDDAPENHSADKMYGSFFELCWSKKKHKREIARIKWAGLFGMDQEPDHKRHHPTQKPVRLAAWFLDRYSAEGDLVLDLFGGSGSTLIACEELGRRCCMCELDPRYVDVIIDRWETLTGGKAVLIDRE